MTSERLSDESVNAFVDGELDADDRLNVLGLSAERDVVRKQLCESRTLKELVKQAYETVPAAERRMRARSWGQIRFPAGSVVGIVAGLMFLAGILAGQALRGPAAPALVHQDPVFLDLGDLVSLAEARKAQGSPSNIVLHLQTNDAGRVADALAKIDEFVQQQRHGSRPVELEIVANGLGLDLLRVARTPYEDRVRQIARQDYVTILACRRAVERLRGQGVTVDLLPEADMAASALDRIIQRLREGWVYVKV